MTKTWAVVGTVAGIAVAILVSSRGSGEAARELQARARPGTWPLVSGPACKPTVPLFIDLQPLASGRWRLHYGSQASDHDAVVWMWCGNESARRLVWRGWLRAGVAQTLECDFTASDAAGPVWAAVEVLGRAGAGGMRSFARAAPHGRSLPQLSATAAALVRDPSTGELILQYTGQTEAGR